MANITSFPFVVQITGDNVSTSAVVGLGYTPATATLVAAYDANNNNIAANILSVVPGSSNVTINFVAAFSGTITVQLALSNATCANSQLQPVTGTFWQTTQPVSGTVSVNSLPTGTNQIGHVIADTGSTTAVTGTVTIAGSKTGNAGVPDGTNLGVLPALANAANPTWTEGDQVLVSADLSGHQRINVNKWGGTLLGTPTNFGTTPGAVVAGSVNSSVFIGTTAAVAATAGVQLVGIEGRAGTSLETTAGVLDYNLKNVNNGAVSTAAAGVQKVGVVGNTGATVDAAIGGAASTNAIWTSSAPSTASAAATTAKFINASGAAISVKASAGNLYGFSITNETAAVAYIEFFNTASAPTLGTTAVVFAVKLPASSNITIPTGDFALMNFSTGIGFAVTTTENGSTTASVTGMLFYL